MSMQIIQSPDSTAQTLGEIFGTEKRIKLFPFQIELLPLLIRYLAESQTMVSHDFPSEWDCVAWLLLNEYPDKIFLVIESPEFELVNRYVPDSLVPLFEPTFHKVDVHDEEQ